MDGVDVGRFEVPETELQWTFGPSGGPGGQHANRSNTRVELRFDLSSTDVFPPGLAAEMQERLGNRSHHGVVTVTVDESRSQFRNRAIARRRLADMLTEAMRRPAPRRRTRPTRASQRKRLDEKRKRSDTKRMRRRPAEPD